jgi:RIO-like serine/threonine protein kinase
VELLKRDLWAETLKVRRDGGDWVLKRSRLVPYLARRERAIYRLLAGIGGVPELHPEAGPNWFLHRWIPGRPLSRRAAVPPGFFDDLERLLGQVHARGVAYADLSKRSNVIVGDDGRAYLVDFQISATGLAARWLMREDLFHLAKLRRGPRRRTTANALHKYLLRKPYLGLRRWFFPRHGEAVGC